MKYLNSRGIGRGWESGNTEPPLLRVAAESQFVEYPARRGPVHGAPGLRTELAMQRGGGGARLTVHVLRRNRGVGGNRPRLRVIVAGPKCGFRLVGGPLLP